MEDIQSNNGNVTVDAKTATINVPDDSAITTQEQEDLYTNRRRLAYASFFAMIFIIVIAMFWLSPEKIVALASIIDSAMYALTGIIFAYISSVTVQEIMGRDVDHHGNGDK